MARGEVGNSDQSRKQKSAILPFPKALLDHACHDENDDVQNRSRDDNAHQLQMEQQFQNLKQKRFFISQIRKCNLQIRSPNTLSSLVDIVKCENGFTFSIYRFNQIFRSKGVDGSLPSDPSGNMRERLISSVWNGNISSGQPEIIAGRQSEIIASRQLFFQKNCR